MQTVTVTARGGVTLPESLLRDAHIAPGEEIEARIFSFTSNEAGSQQKFIQGIVLLKTPQEHTIAEGDANHVYNATPAQKPKQKSKFMAALRACPVKEDLPFEAIKSERIDTLGDSF